MTQRPPQATRPAPSPQAPRNASGAGRPPLIAPIIALIGLIAIATGSLLTVQLFGLTDTAAEPTETPFVELTPDPSTGVLPSVVEITPTPTPHSTIIIAAPPDRTAEVVGTILISKQGDIYTATGMGNLDPVQGTRTGDARYNTAPTWLPGGKRFLYVQTIEREVQAPYDGRLAKYTFFYPNIMSVSAKGGDPKLVYESIYNSGGGKWHRWVLQPDVSPDGETIAVVTDGNDGVGDVLLGLLSIRGTNLRQLNDVPAIDAQGHNDPDWSPDGRRLAFTYNNRRGSIGTPKIGIYTPRTGRTVLLKAGYANPSWSPDGGVIAAERTDGTGRDIVILDPDNGAEIARLTNDGNSFAPTFSPNGDQIAFLRRKGLTVNLWILTLDPANGYTRTDMKPVTEDLQGLDAESPPSWFIPEELRKPLITPAPDSLPTSAPSAGPDAEASPAL